MIIRFKPISLYLFKVSKRWILGVLNVLLLGMPLVFIPFIYCFDFNSGIDIFDSAKGTLLMICGTILLFLFGFSQIQIKPFSINAYERTDFILLIWFAWILCSVIFSKDPILGFFGYHHRSGRLEGGFTYLIYFLCFRFSRIYFKPSLVQVQRYLWICTIMVLYAFLQYIFLDPLVHFKNFRPTIFSTIGNQNFLGTMLQLLAFTALALYFYKSKFQFLVLAYIFFSGIILTQTRSVWVSSAIGLILSIGFMAFKFRKAYLPLLILLIILIGTGFLLNQRPQWYNNTQWASESLSGRGMQGIKDASKLSLESGSGRILIWKLSLTATQEHPFFGTGPEQLKTYLKSRNDSMYTYYKHTRGKTIDKAHNEFLHIAATQGWPALLCYWILLGTLFYNTLRFNRHPFILGMLLTLAMHLIQAQFNISVIAVSPVYWIILGALYGHVKQPEQTHASWT